MKESNLPPDIETITNFYVQHAKDAHYTPEQVEDVRRACQKVFMPKFDKERFDAVIYNALSVIGAEGVMEKDNE